jgi:hypothetical protein
VRVVAGAAGWGDELRARNYHNDAGVKAKLIAEDAARECGERIGVFVPAVERVGKDYVRAIGGAARALEAACGPGVAWWVDYAGVTHAGPRAAVPLGLTRYTVLSYDPRSRVVTLATEDPGDVVIGTQLTQLDAPGVVREFQLSVTPSQARVTAWLDDRAGEPGRLAGLLRAVVATATEPRLYGHYRYRVVSQALDTRVSLQAVRAIAGLPDSPTISQWPGLAGCKLDLTPGAEVLVAFIEGDPAQPVLTHYAGPDGPGFAPIAMTLGGALGLPAARMTDPVSVTMPPAVISGTLTTPAGPQAISGTLTYAPGAQIAVGTITAGSLKVSVA